ncbi:MAG: Gfo/Idh/MocA family oxidoreductase [Defluviitaleaceae bacterium]|nr:Gfo/Idh/MocA family oxidoreductase [Defluviitaleaceae bacterium]
MKKINIGLLGYKFMGKAHSNAYSKLGMFFDLDAELVKKAVFGRDEQWVAAAAKKFGWETYETNWQKFVSRPDLDIIDITAPSNFHKEAAIAAAENNKHVFCEKPLALNTKDARDILAVAKKHNIKHQVGFNYRFAPAIQLAKKIIEDGKIGQIYHFRGNYLQDFIVDPTFPLVWRLDKSVAGSGSHGDLGAHVIDLARYLVGDFKRVMGIQKTFIKERPIVEKMTGLSGSAAETAEYGTVTVDDATIFISEFENGALGSFEATRFAPGHKNDLSFEINGSKGSLRFDLLRINELEYFSRDDEPALQGFRNIQVTQDMHPYAANWWPAGHVIGYEHTFVHEFYEFFNAIINNTPTSPDFYDGMKCCQVLEAVEASVENGGFVNVAEI